MIDALSDVNNFAGIIIVLSGMMYGMFRIVMWVMDRNAPEPPKQATAEDITRMMDESRAHSDSVRSDVNKSIRSVHGRLDDVHARITVLQQEQMETKTKVSNLKEGYDGLNKRLEETNSSLAQHQIETAREFGTIGGRTHGR